MSSTMWESRRGHHATTPVHTKPEMTHYYVIRTYLGADARGTAIN